jgi:hypothetical protein
VGVGWGLEGGYSAQRTLRPQRRRRTERGEQGNGAVKYESIRYLDLIIAENMQ